MKIIFISIGSLVATYIITYGFEILRRKAGLDYSECNKCGNIAPRSKEPLFMPCSNCGSIDQKTKINMRVTKMPHFFKPHTWKNREFTLYPNK